MGVGVLWPQEGMGRQLRNRGAKRERERERERVAKRCRPLPRLRGPVGRAERHR